MSGVTEPSDPGGGSCSFSVSGWGCCSVGSGVVVMPAGLPVASALKQSGPRLSPPVSGGAEVRDRERAVLAEREPGVVRALPDMAVEIAEGARVAAVERLVGRRGEGGA